MIYKHEFIKMISLCEFALCSRTFSEKNQSCFNFILNNYYLKKFQDFTNCYQKNALYLMKELNSLRSQKKMIDCLFVKWKILREWFSLKKVEIIHSQSHYDSNKI